METEATPDPMDPEPLPQRRESDPDTPIPVEPVSHPERPTAITNAKVLTWLQVVLVMICGNCSFGIPLLAVIVWSINRFDLHENPAGVGITSAWIIGFAAICTYAFFTNRWMGRADRRARTTIVIGTVVLYVLTAVTLVMAAVSEPGLMFIVAVAAAPSLIVQGVVLRCVNGLEGRRWFARSGRVAREL